MFRYLLLICKPLQEVGGLVEFPHLYFTTWRGFPQFILERAGVAADVHWLSLGYA